MGLLNSNKNVFSRHSVEFRFLWILTPKFLQLLHFFPQIGKIACLIFVLLSCNSMLKKMVIQRIIYHRVSMILTMILIIIMIINAEDNLSGSFAVDPTSNKPICLASDSCLTKPHPSFIFNKTRCIWCKWHLVHLQIIQVQWCTAQCTLQCAWPSGSERRRRINEELYMYLRIITLSGLVGLRTCTLYLVIPNPWSSILKNIPNFQSSFLNETKKRFYIVSCLYLLLI